MAPVAAAAAVCPIVNTGVFLLSCYVFFMDSAQDIAAAIESPSAGMALFWGMAMANFLIEVGANIVLSPITVRLLRIGRK